MKRILEPEEISLGELDLKLSSKGVRELGVSNSGTAIKVGSCSLAYDVTLSSKIDRKTPVPHIIATCKAYNQEIGVILKDIRTERGMKKRAVYANIIALSSLSAFTLESNVFKIILEYVNKDNCLFIRNARLEIDDIDFM